MAQKVQFPLIQLSSQGQLTLPAEVRQALGLRTGDAFNVRIEDGEIVLEAVEITLVELYSGVRLREFERNAELTEAELSQAKGIWGL